jgi:putative hemolysin
MATSLGVLPSTQTRPTVTYSPQIVPAGPEAELALRLRYRVFAEELGAQLTPQAGRDLDEWDEHCRHLMVRDDSNGDVVGTYRIFPPESAARLGRSYCSTEFDLDNLRVIAPGLVEIGRSCVDPAHRNGAVLTQLWSGLARYVLQSGHRYLGGCASIYLGDGTANAARVVRKALSEHAGPAELVVVPHVRWEYERYLDDGRTVLPPLLRAYLKLGAKVLGEPSYDPDFNTADLYILLDMHAIDPRVIKRFIGA